MRIQEVQPGECVPLAGLGTHSLKNPHRESFPTSQAVKALSWRVRYCPSAGARTKPAVRAMVAALGDGYWHKASVVRAAMDGASDLTARTVNSILASYRYVGVLERRGKGKSQELRLIEDGRIFHFGW